jgi:hypothetical protein
VTGSESVMGLTEELCAIQQGATICLRKEAIKTFNNLCDLYLTTKVKHLTPVTKIRAKITDMKSWTY